MAKAFNHLASSFITHNQMARLGREERFGTFKQKLRTPSRFARNPYCSDRDNVCPLLSCTNAF
jgi:hypothetical protein